MDTIKVKGFILKSPWGSFVHANCELPNQGYITVCKHDIEVPVPADFNPVAAEVSMLEKKLNQVNDEHAVQVQHIKDRIANLLCIEYTPAPAAAADELVTF